MSDLSDAVKVHALTRRALFTFLFLILAGVCCSATANETPSHGWMIELPIQERQTILNLLRSEQFVQLDQHYNSLGKQYEQGVITDQDLILQYQAFYDTSPENETHLNQWIAQNPTSYAARLARGIYLRKLGEQARGTDFVKDTPREHMMKLHEYLERANQDLLDSLKLSQRPIVTVLHLINSSVMRGEKRETVVWLNHANRIDANNYGVRRRYLLSLAPRWGGSYEQMWAFLKVCRDQPTPSDYLRIFEADIYLDQAKSFVEQDQREQALPLYRKALTLLDRIDNSERLEALKGVVYNANATKANLKDFAGEIDEILRLAPNEPVILGYRGWIRLQQHRYGEGIQDFTRGAELGDAYSQLSYGLQLYNGGPPPFVSNRTEGLAWIRRAAEQGNETAGQFLVQVGELEPAVLKQFAKKEASPRREPWWNRVLQGAVWSALMALVMSWVARSRQKTPAEAGSQILVHPPSTLLVGLITFLFFAGIAVLSNVFANETTTWWTTIIFTGFGLLALSQVVDYFVTRHEISEIGLSYSRLSGRRGYLKWSDLRRVRYAPIMKWFRLETRSGDVARVSGMLIGLPHFARMLLAYTPQEAIAPETLPILKETAAGNPPPIP